MSTEKKKKKATSYSDWMSQLQPELHNIPLYKLAIPGSHDSMSYDLDVNSSIIEPTGLKRLSKICCARKIVRRWATTQRDSITKQLNAGVRYFDLRIARKAHDSHPTRLYFHHGLCTRTDVETILKVINNWAKKHPKEILILAFSNFKGFDKQTEEQLHNHLIGFIVSLFGDKLVTIRDTITLRGCWDKCKNVIVSYDRPHHRIDLWSKIPYFYGDSMDTTNIQSKLAVVLATARPTQRFFVCGLNLTLPHNATILKYVLRLCDNFANVVRRSLPRLLQWVTSQAEATPFNIVASDMVTHHDFISTVVNLNASVKP